MNSSLIDGMLGQLQGAPVGQIAQHLGIDPATAQNAIASALPLIVGTLGHHAQQPGGAGALLQSLQQGQAGQDADDQSASGQAPGGASSAGGGGLGGMLGGLLGSLAGGQQGGAGGLGGMLGSVLGGLTGGQQAQSGGGLGGMLGSVLGGGGQSGAGAAVLGQLFGNAQAHAQDGLGQATGLGADKAGQLLQILAPIALSHVAQHAQANNLDADGLNAALSQAHSAVQDQGGVAGNLLGAVLKQI